MLHCSTNDDLCGADLESADYRMTFQHVRSLLSWQYNFSLKSVPIRSNNLRFTSYKRLDRI